jgi:aminocarboxymuconate-semialdehyde decarboxylase
MASLVDVHTHMYPPSYLAMLRSRKTVPYVRDYPSDPISRLVILPGEDEPVKTENDQSSPVQTSPPGRPIGPEYSDVEAKIAFMDFHKIDTSVISLANPWLDFVAAQDAVKIATQTNDELNELCGRCR